MKYTRNNIGQFAGSVIKRAVKWTAKISVISLIGASIVIGYVQYHVAHAEKDIIEIEKVVKVDETKEKVEDVKNELIYALKKCESTNYSEQDGLLVLDTNNKASIGLWQYQITTVIYYYKKLYGKTISKKEAIEIALNEEKARQLTYDIMFKTNNAPTEWVKCSKDLDLKLKIDVLKKL